MYGGLELYNLWRSFRSNARKLERANRKLREAINEASKFHWKLKDDARMLLAEVGSKPLAKTILTAISEAETIGYRETLWAQSRDLDMVVALLGQESEAGR